MKQDFAAVLRIAKNEKDVDPDLLQLAKNYSQNQNSGRCLATEDFISLIRELCLKPSKKTTVRRVKLAEKMVVYDSLLRDSVEAKARIVREWIRMYNPRWRTQGFMYDAETETVRLRGKWLRRMRIAYKPKKKSYNSGNMDRGIICFLHTLKPRVLDLRNTEVRDLSDLTNLQLHELDLRQTPVTDLSPLFENHSLRRIYVDWDQMPQAQLAKLPSWIEVVQDSVAVDKVPGNL